MEVEIRLSEQCPSPKIVIVTSHMTEELEALVRLLQQDQIRSIPGFQGSHIVPLEPRISCGSAPAGEKCWPCWPRRRVCREGPAL